jgi:hypothetical protein
LLTLSAPVSGGPNDPRFPMVGKRCCTTISEGSEAVTFEISPYHDREIVILGHDSADWLDGRQSARRRRRRSAQPPPPILPGRPERPDPARADDAGATRNRSPFGHRTPLSAGSRSRRTLRYFFVRVMPSPPRSVVSSSGRFRAVAKRERHDMVLAMRACSRLPVRTVPMSAQESRVTLRYKNVSMRKPVVARLREIHGSIRQAYRGLQCLPCGKPRLHRHSAPGDIRVPEPVIRPTAKMDLPRLFRPSAGQCFQGKTQA